MKAEDETQTCSSRKTAVHGRVCVASESSDGYPHRLSSILAVAQFHLLANVGRFFDHQQFFEYLVFERPPSM